MMSVTPDATTVNRIPTGQPMYAAWQCGTATADTTTRLRTACARALVTQSHVSGRILVRGWITIPRLWLHPVRLSRGQPPRDTVF